MFLTVSELSIKLGVKESWVRQQVFKRNIPYKKLNRLLRFEWNQIEKWLSTNQKKTENYERNTSNG